MLAKLFTRLTNYPVFKRLFWKPVYNFLARQLPTPNWQFMNYGYAVLPDSSEPPLSLPSEYEFQRYPLQMYHYLAMLSPLQGKHVLEVGSGRGGGGNYLYHSLNPASYTGMDCARVAIDFSRQHYHGAHLEFEVGDAERLPFEGEKFDIVLNIESSRHYGSFPTFLSEVNRVLRPGGKLLLADMRMDAEVDGFRAALQQSGMSLLSEEDITQNVLISLDHLYESYLVEIEKQVPAYFRHYFIEFSAAKGTVNYEAFQKRERRYFRMVLQKN
ncbi:MAG: methyltransferase domain-containing protein [Saprospirales bacterium]|nr:methyltransferase domain-containing protein [Saprospirales bacterium]MBK8492846.1 methyltransferase domain-containing protein [Saprospirales bacterium]